MNNENKTHMCNCKEVEKKLISLLKDNGKLLQMIRDLRKENERLSGELGRPDSTVTGSRPVRTGDNDNNAEVRSLVEINHGWKRDYEELQMRYEMLSGEKRLLEEEEKELKERIDDLEKRQGPLESELTRLATTLYTQSQQGQLSRNDEQCEVLKTQITVYKEDFERERRDREKIHQEKEKLKRELEGAEEIIQRLTTELDACKGIGERRRSGDNTIAIRGENGYLGERTVLPVRHQLQLVHPFGTGMSEGEYRWRLEQHRRGILPRSPPPTSFFYGGDVEVDRCSR